MALKPTDIKDTAFKRSALGRRGYDEVQVDQFLRRVATEWSKAIAANQRLMRQLESGTTGDLAGTNDYLAARVADLESQLAERDADPLGGGPTVAMLWDEVEALRRENAQLRDEAQDDVLGVNIRAVNMLSQAQMAAEATVSEAERYARDIVTDARGQYADILRQAQDSAAQAVDGIAALATTSATVSPAEVEYVRTYAQIAQKQMQSIIDALCAEVAKLGHTTPPAGQGNSGQGNSETTQSLPVFGAPVPIANPPQQHRGREMDYYRPEAVS